MHSGLVLIVRFHLSGEAAEEESEVDFLGGEESEEIPREVEISGARVEEPELTGEPLLVGTSERAGEFVEDSFELFPGVLRAAGTEGDEALCELEIISQAPEDTTRNTLWRVDLRKLATYSS